MIASRSRRRWTIAAAALLMLQVACKDEAPADAKAEGGEKDAIAVKVQAPTRGSIAQTYATSTTLMAEQEATVIARTVGVIERLAVEEGARVSAGQTLAQLEDDEQAISLARARLTAEARAREYERQQQLKAQDLTSDVDLELSRGAAEDAAEALKLAELNMERTTIRAPFGGVVLRRHLSVGASVSSGTAVYDIADVDPLIAEVRIPERHVAALKVGQTAHLFADASATQVEGRILRIAPSVDPTSGTVKVTVAAGGADLRPGAFVKVSIVTDTHEDALVVPRTTLVAEGRRWHVYEIAEGGEKVIQREVELGFEDGDRVELLPVAGAEPIADGAVLVTVGAPALSDGARIEIIPEDGAPAAEAPAATEAGAGDGAR